MTVLPGLARDFTESQNKLCWNSSLKPLSLTFDQTSPCQPWHQVPHAASS